MTYLVSRRVSQPGFFCVGSNLFARLTNRAEHGNAIEITRRGEPVAVLVSASEYAATTGERSSFIKAARQVRSRMGVESLGIGDADFDDLREESPGRDVSL